MPEPRDTPLWVLTLLDKNLSAAERLVLMCLCWHQGCNGSAWPSQETLSGELGISERNVRRLIQGLIAKGRVRISRPANQGRGMANTYVVVPSEKGGQPCPPSESPKADNSAPLSGTKGGQNRPKRGAPVSSQHIRNTVVAHDQIIYDPASNRFTGVTADRKADWRQVHPTVDVERELLGAAIWWRDHPGRRRKDIPRFLSNWMSRAERGFPDQRRESGYVPAESLTRELDDDEAVNLQRKVGLIP